MDNTKKLIQITAGRGPAECEWVVAQVLKKILDEGTKNGLLATVIDRETGSENGTVASALVMFEGESAGEFLKNWIGTIQWIGKSTFRKFHKRKNWFIGIFEIEQAQNKKIDENQIDYQAIRSSGAGGQHVNKVSSAVRATHRPTGISVVSMDSRSQHQNKKIATERLKLKLNEANLKEIQEQFQATWGNQTKVERGNPIRTFEGTDFKKQKIDKSYKTERLSLKKQMNQNDFEF